MRSTIPPELLEQMIETKRHPENFRIIERDFCERPKKATRCLVFRVYDSCATGHIEGALMERGIEYVSNDMEECTIFNVMRSGMKWDQIKDLIKSIYPAKCYFTKIDFENNQVCA